MKTGISAEMLAHLASGSTTLCTCWLATLTNGTVVAATSHTSTLEFPPSSGVFYLSTAAYTPSDIESGSNLAPDNLELEGFLASPHITAEDIHSGLWDYAAIEIFEVNYRDLTMGRNRVREGTLGEVTAGLASFRAELRGLMQAFSRRIIRLIAKECDADLGDSRCKVDLAPWTVTGAIDSVTSARQFTDAARTEANDWFTAGKITFTSGLNMGLSMEVKDSTSAGVIKLHHLMPFAIAPGDTYEMSAGCAKRFTEDCIGKFDNGVNFRGFPHLPGVKAFGGPGTAIRAAPAPAPFPAPTPAPTPAPAPAPTPAPPPSPAPFAIGVNIHEGGANAGENTTVAAIMDARNFTIARMDLFTGGDTAHIRDQISKIIANGGTVQGILLTPQQSDHTIYTGGALATLEADAYADTLTLVNLYKDLVTDFELLNEVPLRAECLGQVASGTGQLESAYTGKTAFISIGRALKGMADAVHDAGGGLRTILGTTSRDWGFIKYMQTLGVDVDVVGWHVYPALTDASLLTDTWYGTGGPLTQLDVFGLPITINEFHSGEIYGGSYENTAGQTHTEDGFEGLTNHFEELYTQTDTANLESVIAYELLDEPAKSAPENHFGLMYDLTTPKVSLYIATAFAGGTLSAPERLEITSRGLLTDEEIDAMQP